MSDAVYWARPDGRLAYVNAAAGQMLGYTAAELMTLSVQDLVPGYTSAAWSADWHSLKQAGFLTFESLHKRKDGEVLPVEIRVDYMAWEGAEYACGLARDITERVRLQTALRGQAVRDPSPACSTAATWTRPCHARSVAANAPANPSSPPCSTWTTSSA